ncbi:MAG: hypothetical protein ACHQ49_02785 [Elusimicrobiota bacterium]
MNARAARALQALEAMNHEDVLDAAGSLAADGGGRRSLSILQGLGAHRLEVFAAVHGGELRRIASLPGGDADSLAARGRARRLLGLRADARRDLSAAARMGHERARAWLAETMILRGPKRALGLLSPARGAAITGPGPACWRAAALLALGRRREALDELDGGGPGGYARLALRVAVSTALRRPSQARAAAAAAFALEPGVPFAPAALRKLAVRAGDRRAELDFYHRARNLDLDVGGGPPGETGSGGKPSQKTEAAVARLDAILRRNPKSLSALVERAELLRHPRFCRYDEAFRDYAAAVRLQPDRGWLLALLARALNHRDGGRAGLAEFDRAVESAPESGWIRAWRGAALSRVGETGRAAEDFDAAVELMPWYPSAYAWRGALRRRLGRAAEAAKDLDVALALDPSYPFSWNERFQARLETGDASGAARDLLRAFRLNPKYTWADVRGAGRAARELDAAVRARPDDPWLRAWRGHSRLRAKRPRAAVADLRNSVRTLGREPLLVAWLGGALAAAGRLAEGEKHLRFALRLDPRSWIAHKTLADLHSARADWARALPHRRRAAELAPTSVPLLIEHASAAARLGRDAEALASLEKAARLAPRTAEARAFAAEIHLRAGRLPEAAAEVAGAFAAGGGSRAHLARARLRNARGDFAGQIEDFRAALAAGPELFEPGERRRLEELLRGADGGAR